MASLNQTKSRLTSVKSTQKIIRAMELVASAKIKKSRDKAKNIDFFFNSLVESLAYINQYKRIQKRIFVPGSQEKTLIIVITSDMGLCGAYNANIIKKTIEEIKLEKNIEILVVGTKGFSKLSYEGYQIDQKIVDNGQKNEYKLSQEITRVIKKELTNKAIDNIKIIYTEFINPLIQEVEMINFADIENQLEKTSSNKAVIQMNREEEVFEHILDFYLVGLIYSIILKSYASEHAYRRNAMESSNKNSLELIDTLNLEINRIRQAMITQEISEIIGGSEALSKE